MKQQFPWKINKFNILIDCTILSTLIKNKISELKGKGNCLGSIFLVHNLHNKWIFDRTDGWQLNIAFVLNKKLLNSRVEAALTEAHADVEEIYFEERPTRSKCQRKLPQIWRCFRDFFVAHWLYAAFWHHPESCHPVVGLESSLDATNDVVRFQHQQHLTIDFFENVRNVRKHQSTAGQQQFFLIRIRSFFADSRHDCLPRSSRHHASKDTVKIAANAQIVCMMSHCFSVHAENAEPKLCVFVTEVVWKVLKRGKGEWKFLAASLQLTAYNPWSSKTMSVPPFLFLCTRMLPGCGSEWT